MRQSLNGASAERRREELTLEWKTDPRWAGIERPYAAEEVMRLGGSVRVEHTLGCGRR
jgi:isocitrate/methylisocitrate lyase